MDGLRAISILLVVIFHVLMSFTTSFSFLYFAFLGVQFFFVISGFLITTLLLKEKVATGGIRLRKFYARRCLGILPVAYLYLLALWSRGRCSGCG
jgi:peptidoglycan/LPS O-acetylase OafA/YrhL